MSAITAKKFQMPRDLGADVFQKCLFPYTSIQISFSDEAGKNSDPISAQILRVISSKDCFISIGDASVVADLANSCFIKAGEEYFFSLRGNKYISVVSATADDENTSTLYVSVMV